MPPVSRRPGSQLYDKSMRYVLFSLIFGTLFWAAIRLVLFFVPNGRCEPFYQDKVVNGKKLILYATTFFGDVEEPAYYVNRDLDSCPDFKCVAISSAFREACFEKADAIIFHPAYEDFYQAIAFLARKRRRNHRQYWIFKSFETPYKITQMVPRGDAFYDWADGLFNLSLTYRFDSDVPAPYRKGFEKIPGGKHIPFKHEMFKKKTRHIAAVISHCRDVWNRQSHLKSLEAFGVTVDIFGKCGNKFCPGLKSNDACYRQLQEDYFFYAAAENSICKDYVSEKFFMPLMFNMIVVAVGGANYSRIAPPNSFINWGDFRTPKELAEYLLTVSSNETAYAEFFKWKGLYQFHDPPYEFACNLCDLLRDRTPKVLKGLKKWWIGESGCTANPYKQQKTPIRTDL